MFNRIAPCYNYRTFWNEELLTLDVSSCFSNSFLSERMNKKKSESNLKW